MIVARSAEEIAAIVADAKTLGGGACEGHVADVSRWEECSAAVERAERLFGTIQFLINNAALRFSAKQAAPPLGTPFPFWTYDPDDIIDMVKVNLLGQFAMFSADAPKW